jgi:signal transduction histidine kinase/FixJ family two-component response regulator
MPMSVIMLEKSDQKLFYTNEATKKLMLLNGFEDPQKLMAKLKNREEEASLIEVVERHAKENLKCLVMEDFVLQNKENEEIQTAYVFQKAVLNTELINVFLFESTKKMLSIQSKVLSKYKNALLCATSHDLNTPMNGVLQILEQMPDAIVEGRNLKSIALFSAKLLAAKLSDFLDYSRNELGILKINSSVFSPLEMLLDLQKLFGNETINHGVRFILDLPKNADTKDEELVVTGDEKRIKRILITFLINAFKYTTKGYVILRLVLKQNPKQTKWDITFEVEDSGKGMGSHQCLELFKVKSHKPEFGKEDEQDNTQMAGVNLAIAQMLAFAMKGEIKVKSILGMGSTFSFHLYQVGERKKKSSLPPIGSSNSLCPAKPHKKKSSEKRIDDRIYKYSEFLQDFDDSEIDIFESESVHTVNDTQCEKLNHMQSKIELDKFWDVMKSSPKTITKRDESKILLSAKKKTELKRKQTIPFQRDLKYLVVIVDDNNINRYGLKMMLLNTARTVELEDGKKALDFVKNYYTNPKDNKGILKLILMDINMPVMDGNVATKKIRHFFKKRNLIQIPIIAVTACADIDPEEYNKQGFNEVYSKPVNKQTIEILLERYVNCKSIQQKYLDAVQLE